MGNGIVRPDSSGRVNLARYGVKPGQTFEMKVYEDGRIILSPVEDPERGHA